MKHKPSKLVIFLSVFIDLIGFGIVLPLLPNYAEDNLDPSVNVRGWVIGGIIASFSLMQFFFAPIWGRLSDRIGRRPVMLISNLGAAGSYALFAYACGLSGNVALIWMLISRIFAGICGANLSVASAYLADITPPEKRSAAMGLIGMAFGLGFIFGPPIGALSAGWFGPHGPGAVAAAFCTANFVLGWFILGESRKPDSAPAARRPKVNQWMHTLTQPKLGLLILIFFFATFCFTCFEATFSLLAKHMFGFGTDKHDQRVGYLFAYAGVVSALLQGGLTGRLVKKMGEAKLIFVSLLVYALSLFALPFATTIPELLIVLALLAIGSGLNRPPVFGMISLKSSASEQGANLGVAQSFGSLARILGPMFAVPLFYVNFNVNWLEYKIPYLICGGIALVTGLFAWKSLCHDSAGAPVGTSTPVMEK